MKNIIVLVLTSMLLVGCAASSDTGDTSPESSTVSNNYYRFVLEGDVSEMPTSPVSGDKIYEIYSVHHLKIEMLMVPSVGSEDPNFLALKYYKSETSQVSYDVETDYYTDGLTLECDIPDFLVYNVMPLKGYLDLTTQTLMLKSDETKTIADLPKTPCLIGAGGNTASADIGIMNIIFEFLNSNFYLTGTVSKDSSILDSTVETPMLFDGQYDRNYGLSIKPMNISYAPTLTYQGMVSDVTEKDLKGWVNALTQETL